MSLWHKRKLNNGWDHVWRLQETISCAYIITFNKLSLINNDIHLIQYNHYIKFPLNSMYEFTCQWDTHTYAQTITAIQFTKFHLNSMYDLHTIILSHKFVFKKIEMALRICYCNKILLNFFNKSYFVLFDNDLLGFFF